MNPIFGATLIGAVIVCILNLVLAWKWIRNEYVPDVAMNVLLLLNLAALGALLGCTYLGASQ